LLAKRMIIVFLLLGFISLFADITYEGARSVLGAYLEYLEASIFIAGVISIGDLLNYFMRGISGFIAGYTRSSRVYWCLVLLGYSINLFAVPLLAFVGKWELAFILVLIERMGKGLRSPVRDVILAEVTEGIGRGMGFGLHELMDQIGAILGPGFVAWSLYINGGDFRIAFKYLFIPASIAILLVIVAMSIYPRIHSVEIIPKNALRFRGFNKRYYLYIASMMFLSMGFIHWHVVSYYIEQLGIISKYLIASLYLVAMASDAITALPVGFLYDKIKLKILLITPLLPVLIILLFTSISIQTLFIMSIAWGILLGIYETVMRASIADLVEPGSRAYAYGLYGLVFGSSWTIGNVLIGILLNNKWKNYLIIYVIVVEIISFIILLKIVKEQEAASS